MPNFVNKRQEFAGEMIALSSALLTALDDCDNLDAAYSVNGFNSGGANEFEDEDFGGVNTHLSASIVADVMFALGTLRAAATEGLRDALRKALPGGLP